MNAHFVRKSAKDLNKYQRGVILGVALREVDDLLTRAKRLRKLSYCTDEAKFEVLKESDTVSEGLYDSLYDLYFGTVQEDVQGEQDSEQDTGQDSEQDVGQGEQPGKEKRSKVSGHHNKAWTHSECVRLIEGYNQGLTHKQLAAMFGVSCAAASQRLIRMRKGSQYSGLFTENIDAKAGRPGTHYKFWTGEKCGKLIKAYKQGLPLESIGELFGVSKAAVIQKLCRLKKDERFSKLFADEQEEPKTAESVVTVSQEEMPQKKVGLPKAFTATGTGLLTVEDGLKLDGEPLLTMLRQEIVKRGVEQFYADVEIVIRPAEPEGMVVTTEEEE